MTLLKTTYQRTKSIGCFRRLGSSADIQMPEAVMVRGGIGEAIMPSMPNVFRVGGMADGGIMEMANVRNNVC